MSFAAATFADVRRLRQTKPLVVNITNNVVTNFTANALLALGASPAMTHAPADAAALAAMAQALVVNMGTPAEEYVASMEAAIPAANAAGVPVVFDPVAAGATPWRREVLARVLGAGNLAAMRGNASEIMAVAGENVRSRGADSLHGSSEAREAAMAVAREHGCVVCVSGETDIVTDGRTCRVLAGGHAMMTLVTGMGCAATAVVGAFVGIQPDAFAATVHAMAVMSAAGAMAAAGAAGPGTLQLRFLDALYTLTEADLNAGAREVA